MSQIKDDFHGSDLEKIEELYGDMGVKKEEIVNFAANVNPLGISPLLREKLAAHIDVIRSYPDRDYTGLRKCIAEYAKTDAEKVLVGNGASELISLFIQTKKPKKAMILAPTYSEYEREITLGGGTCLTYPLSESNDFQLDLGDFLKQLEKESKWFSPIDLLVICNPNNPTSTSVSGEDMGQILDKCTRHGIFLLIDETYVEFADDYEGLTAVPFANHYPNLLVLRGTSKFFATPGLRLGYAITGNHDLRAAMANRQNPWSVHSLAVVAGELMFSDVVYREKSRSLILEERDRVYNLLKNREEFRVFKPSANFLLLKILKEGLSSKDLLENALREGMLIRDCSGFPFLNDNFVRFCIMLRSDNDRLLELFQLPEG